MEPQNRTLESVKNISGLTPSYKDTPLYSANVSTDRNEEYLLKGIQESSLLSKSFFSNDNVSEIQRLLRFNVYKNTQGKYLIDYQNVTEMLLIMRSIFLQYQGDRSPGNPGDDNLLIHAPGGIVNKRESSVYSEIIRLNTLVLREIVPSMISSIEQYYGYLRDSSSTIKPIDRPVNPSVKGLSTQLRDTSDILFV